MPEIALGGEYERRCGLATGGCVMVLEGVSDLELAACLCSRICHDVISPVSAVVNGLDLVESESDADMREDAMSLVRRSAASASARLQFLRLAFGAAGATNAEISLRDARSVVEGFLAAVKVELEWIVPELVLEQERAKLLLNLIMIGVQSIPRGGRLSVTVTLEPSTNFILESHGDRACTPRDAKSILVEKQKITLNSQNVQLYYTALLAERCRARIAFDPHDGGLRITATPGDRVCGEG